MTSRKRSGRGGLIAGLGVLALLTAWAAFLWLRAGPIERDITDRATAVLADAGLGWVRVVIDGRDVTLGGLADDRATRQVAVDLVGAVWGVRSVTDAMRLPPRPGPVFRVDLVGIADPAAGTLPGVMLPSVKQPGIVLSGRVADRAIAADLVDVAGLAFPGAVTDLTSDGAAATADAGPPLPRQAAMRHAVEVAGMLTAGGITLINRRFEVVGTADDPDGVRDLIVVPDGFEPRIAINATAAGRAPVGSWIACQARLDGLLDRAPVLFPGGGADIGASGRAVLDVVATTLAGCPGRPVRIEGHTDATGSRTANLALSWRRATAVAAFLERRGVDPARLQVHGFGADLPVASNNTPDGRAANRRTELRVLE